MDIKILGYVTERRTNRLVVRYAFVNRQARKVIYQDEVALSIPTENRYYTGNDDDDPPDPRLYVTEPVDVAGVITERLRRLRDAWLQRGGRKAHGLTGGSYADAVDTDPRGLRAIQSVIDKLNTIDEQPSIPVIDRPPRDDGGTVIFGSKPE